MQIHQIYFISGLNTQCFCRISLGLSLFVDGIKITKHCHGVPPPFLCPPCPPSGLSIDQRGREDASGSSFVSIQLWSLNPAPALPKKHCSPPFLPPSLLSRLHAGHIPLLLWWWPSTSPGHLHLLSIKWIGSFPPLNSTLMLGRREGTCACNQSYTEGQEVVGLFLSLATMINEVQLN